MIRDPNAPVMNRHDLIYWRCSHWYTCAEFADVLGVTETTVNRWESGMREPNWVMLRLALKGLSFSHGPHCTCALPNCGRQTNRNHPNGRSYDPYSRQV